VQLVSKAAGLRRLARVRRELVDCVGDGSLQVGDRAGLEVRFDRALAALYMVYQPIITWNRRAILGYEALVRSREPTMPHPGALLDAAERLDRTIDLGRAVRVASILPMQQAPAHALLFINLHSRELLDESLTQTSSPLTPLASRVVLEITERARLEQVPNVLARIQALRELGFRIAIDDIGAGYAGLTSWATLEPDIVKLDMALVRDVHLAQTKRRLVQSVVQACSDLGMIVIAEGVEQPQERDALLELGCENFQGYLFAKPADPFPVPNLG
jgi:EAL domain-containing protein (putative c-di-GMP-specific phosphodiesterase class I)